MKSNILSVREQSSEDVQLIVNYFHNADNNFLENMGVDRAKLFERENWLKQLNDNLKVPNKQKEIYYLIWLMDNVPIGHCNINKIIVKQEAYMHLHLWNKDKRQKGFGFEFLKLSIPLFFKTFNLKKLYCEPYSLNPAPNKILAKFGFKFIKNYETTPGAFNFHQTVNQWCINKEKLIIKK